MQRSMHATAKAVVVESKNADQLWEVPEVESPAVAVVVVVSNEKKTSLRLAKNSR